MTERIELKADTLERNARIALKEYISYWRNVNEGDTEPERAF